MSTLLNEIENEAAVRFAWDHHQRPCTPSLFRGPATLTLTATQSGLGFQIEVRCPYCKGTLDITDYRRW